VKGERVNRSLCQYPPIKMITPVNLIERVIRLLTALF